MKNIVLNLSVFIVEFSFYSLLIVKFINDMLKSFIKISVFIELLIKQDILIV